MKRPLVAIRRGSTLIELVVVLAVIAIVGAAFLVAPGPSGPNPHGVAAAEQLLREARRSAIASGKPVLVHVRLSSDGQIAIDAGARPGTIERSILALPDGGVIADSGIAIDRLNGSLLREAAK